MAFCLADMSPRKMHKYNSDHDSGVMAYSIEKNGIIVLFREGWYYLYDNIKPGAEHLKNMIVLAKKGEGLSTYISQHVRENYQRKWRRD